MQYLKDLETVVLINSYTKNKRGVDKVGLLFDKWLNDLGFSVNLHKRQEIGNHRYYTSKTDSCAKKLLLLGHLDTVFPEGKFDTFKMDDRWVYGPGYWNQ